MTSVLITNHLILYKKSRHLNVTAFLAILMYSCLDFCLIVYHKLMTR